MFCEWEELKLKLKLGLELGLGLARFGAVFLSHGLSRQRLVKHQCVCPFATTTTRVGFFDKPPAQKPRAVYLNALAGTKTEGVRFGAVRWGGWLCVLCLGCFLIDISKRISDYAKAFVQTTATETDAKWN